MASFYEKWHKYKYLYINGKYISEKNLKQNIKKHSPYYQYETIRTNNAAFWQKMRILDNTQILFSGKKYNNEGEDLWYFKKIITMSSGDHYNVSMMLLQWLGDIFTITDWKHCNHFFNIWFLWIFMEFFWGKIIRNSCFSGEFYGFRRFFRFLILTR